MIPELAQLAQAIDRFEDTVTEALRSVAFRKSREVMARAKDRVPVDSGYTRDNIHVVEDLPNKQYLVIPGTDRPRARFSFHDKKNGRGHTQRVTLNMLPNWLEYGTRYMAARPFMRPAADEVTPSYQREMVSAATKAAEELSK